MVATPEYEIPDFDTLLGGMVEGVDAAKRPLLMAMLERVAAAKYREWAEAPDYREKSAVLIGCAAREEEIAGKVEALYPDPQTLQKEILEAMPELGRVSHDLFGDRTLPHQMAVLAAGERAGGRVWQRLAGEALSATARETMIACTPLEDENAEALETILRGG